MGIIFKKVLLHKLGQGGGRISDSPGVKTEDRTVVPRQITTQTFSVTRWFQRPIILTYPYRNHISVHSCQIIHSFPTCRNRLNVVCPMLPRNQCVRCFCVTLLWRLLTQFLYVFQRNRMMDVIFGRSSSPWLRNHAGTMQGSYPCPLRSQSGNQPIPAQGSHQGVGAACSFWNFNGLRFHF